MIRVFVGNDVVRVRAEAHVFLDECGEVIRFSADEYEPEALREYVGAQSLFGGGLEPVVLDFLSEHEDALEEVEKLLIEMAASPRVFVFVDQKPKVAFEKKLRTHAVSYEEIAERAEKERFNTFALADALSRKDKRSLWVLLMRARMAEIAPEEIAGVLFWQLKSLILAERTSNAADAGMKDYPYKKARGALKDFKKGETERLSRELLTLYHRGHAESDMDLLLERFVLTL